MDAAALPGSFLSDTPVAVLAMLAADKLSVLQTLDPAAYEGMRSNLAEIMDALKEALEAQAGGQSQVYTNSLVLAVQQLVSSLREPGAGGLNVDAMVASQEALQAWLLVREG